eukprot:TRINITY_DN42155_c0_g1_i1.p1 TRINITY_DN42155_c0_g1~~TRINITY_DN42155_c0_g1_i1.p1  ORF type:complete len:126 (-),score=11.86 TRINITY_DN42155_c0_g1_i1:33-356(-)
MVRNNESVCFCCYDPLKVGRMLALQGRTDLSWQDCLATCPEILTTKKSKSNGNRDRILEKTQLKKRSAHYLARLQERKEVVSSGSAGDSAPIFCQIIQSPKQPFAGI